MEIVQQLLEVLNIYKDNSELISSAVTGIRLAGSSAAPRLARALEERKRRLILKAIALLARSDIPAKVVEVDGLDDAELLAIKDKGYLKNALAIFFRQQELYDILFQTCSSKFGEGTAFYSHSILAAAWDSVELGDEDLIKLVKPEIYDCTASGRQYLENGRLLCDTAWNESPVSSIPCKILAFQASRDVHRRFALVSAVLLEINTGKVFFYEDGTMKASEKYSLDPNSCDGLNFEVSGATGDTAGNTKLKRSLTLLCSMYAEANGMAKERTLAVAVQLVNDIVCRLSWGFQECITEIDRLARTGSIKWIPTKNDLREIHIKSNDNLRSHFQRTFHVKAAAIRGIKGSQSPMSAGLKAPILTVLDCISGYWSINIGEVLIAMYKEQQYLAVHERTAGTASVFATYIYSSLKKPAVAEEYREIFSSRKVNICVAKSGTQVFVPHSGAVTMTTFGMQCEPIETTSSQIFSYESGNRFAFLPHLLQILELRDDDQVLTAFYKEMDDNAYLVADPMTDNVQAAMLRSLETHKRQFRVSTLHESARQIAPDDYPGLVREAISILARLGASVPPEYVGRSCFYDVTRQLKGYNHSSTQFYLLFDRGVTLEHVGCEVSVNAGESILVSASTESENSGYIIASITKKNLRRRPPRVLDAEFQAMKAAIEGSGLVFMEPQFEVHGDIHLAVTQSNPGRGLFSVFSDCYATGAVSN